MNFKLWKFLTPIDLTEKLAHFKISRIKSMYIVTKSKDIQKIRQMTAGQNKKAFCIFNLILV